MRRKHFLAMTLCALSFTSCDFEQDFGDSRPDESADVAITVKATADDAFTQAKGGLWNAGDALKLRLSGDAYEDEADCISLTAAAGGTAEVSFTGVLPSYRGNDNAYMYYSTDGEFAGTGFTETVSSQQSGKAEDMLDNVMYYSWARWDAIDVSSDGKAVQINADMAPMAALLKFNVPAELQATDVRVKASSPIAGVVTVNPQRGWGSVGENALLYAVGASDEIVINGGNPVSGDLYVVVMPDTFDPLNNTYCNSAETVLFSCTCAEGDLAKKYTLKDYMLCGSLTDLGVIPLPKPKIPVEGGKIRLMPDANLTIGIADANPDCEYYYEIGSSASDCAEPTVNSTKFDPQVGFAPEITGHFDGYYIKVLVNPFDTDYKSVVLTASLRHWKFNNTCPTAAVYREAATLLAQNPSEVKTEDGLYVRRRSTAELKYTESAGSIEFNNCIVPFMLVEQTADVYMYLQTSNVYNVGSQRTINLFKFRNGETSVGRGDTFNDFPTKTQIFRPDDGIASRVSVVWHLGNVAADYKLAFAPDSKNTYYAQAILQVF